MSVQLDHLVVAAATLEQGVAWCEATLGLVPGPGGRHAQFGTHNRLFSIAGAGFERAYFEIIAIDPAAPAPARARWFGLDDAALQGRLRTQGPLLLHAVVRSEALEADRAALAEAGFDAGRPLHAWRDTPAGRLEWEILVRDDGALPGAGTLPTLICWRGVHPTATMPDVGVRLRALEWRGLPPPLFERFAPVGATLGATLGAGPGPVLRAHLTTPRGDLILESA